MSVSTRAATQADLPWLVSRLRELSGIYGTKRSLFPTDSLAASKLADFIAAGHVLIVAERSGQLVGFIAGHCAPHFFNPELTMLTHLFWWVDEAHRRTRAAFLLLQDFIREGRERAAHWVTLNLHVSVPVKLETLIKVGFQPREFTLVMEVA